MQTIRQGLNVHTDNLSSLANKDIQVNSGVVQKYETSTGSVTIKQGVDVYVVTPTNNAVTVTIPSGLGINNYVRTVEIIIHNSSNTNSNTVTVSQTGYSIAYGYPSYTFVTNLVLNVSILGTLLILRSSDDVVGRAVSDSVGNPILTTYAKKTDVVNKSTQLTDIQDLNTIKTEGIYYQSLNANATAANHYPVTKAGSLVVLKNSANGADGCTQLYYPYETQVQYQRKYLAASTSWTPWDTGVNSLMRNTAYKVGDIAYSPNLPSWAYLECITAGTTGDTEPDFSTVGGGAIINDGTTTFKIRSIADLVKNIEDLQTKNTQLTNQLVEVTTIQKVDVSFNSTYVDDVGVYKAGHVVNGYCSFHKSGTEPDIPVITNLPKALFGWGAIITPLRAHFQDGNFIRVHMEMGETVINLHYSTSWKDTQGNEAELSFTYITAD